MTSRSATFCSSRGSKKPAIQHPLFRFSVDGSLEIRGQQSDLATNVPNEDSNRVKNASVKDFVFDSNNNTSTGHILQWPPEFMKNSSPPKKAKKKERVGKKQVLSYQEELDYQIREKLTSGFYAVRHLFKANDSYGHGIVSREALRHILFALVGYIEGYQFTKFLKRHGLDNKPTVSFDTFVACFQGGENGKKEWVSPCQRASVEKKSYPEEHLRNNDYWLRDTSFQSGTYCFSLFKQKARDKDFDMNLYLPPACFKRDGKIVPPQLREAMAVLGLKMTNVEFHKVWDRFDWEGIGAIKTKHLLKILGLGSDGKQVKLVQSAKPKQKETKTSPVQLEVTNSAIWREQEAQKNQEVSVVKKEKSSTEWEEIELKRKKSETKLKEVKSSPSVNTKACVENVIDCLTSRFEESINSLQSAFELFDHGKNGLVSKIDFRRVLLEFGFNLPLQELDVFMMRCSLRPIKDEMKYRDFLKRYQSKGEGSLTHRIITSDRFHNCSHEESSSNQPISPEDLEIQLVLLLHGEFMRFVRMLRKHDVHDVGVVTQSQLRDVLEKFLGFQLSDKQFNRVVKDIGQETEGLVPYYKLLQIFTSNPKEWNKKLDWGRGTLHGDYGKRPKTTVKVGVDAKQLRESMATTKELEIKIKDVLNKRFHSFDKNFKHMDKRKTGRLNRIELRELLKLCGVELQTEEMLLVWSSMGVRHDGVIAYAQFLSHFMKQHPETLRKVTRPEDKEVPLHQAKRMVKKAKTFVTERGEQSKGAMKEEIETVRQTVVSRQMVDIVEKKETELDKKLVDEALKKIYDQVLSNWDNLKERFRQLDANGFANIPVAEMKILLTKFTNNLIPEEITAILQRYDTKKNGRFAYMQFMRQCKQDIFLSEEHSSSRTSRPQTAPATAYREPVGKCLQQFQNQVLAKWKNVRQAFKALDMNSDGYVSPNELRRVLKKFGIRETEGNLYHLMSEFDTNMDGKISYKEFLEHCLPL